ncbi:MAG: FAD-dependent oxidoreductase [Bacteroidota bacterium]
MKVVIIGGGVIGLCSAYYLNKSGYDVTVIERNDITNGCSFGNMGYISPSHFVPLATPGIIAQGLKWMMSSTSPFYIKPRLNLDLIKWGLAFKNSANAKHVEESGPHLNNLLQLSRTLMSDLKKELPAFDMIEKGCWMLYKSEKTEAHEKHLAEQAHVFGLKTELCSAEEVQAREPQVEVNVAGGVLYLDDCHVSPQKFMQSLYSYLQKSGVQFWINSDVTAFEKKGDRIHAVITSKGKVAADEIVIANGSWLQEISKLLNVKILMQPGKGYSIVYNDLEKNLQYPSILVDDRTATAPIGRWLRIGGTMELSGHSDNILPKRVMAVYNAFKKYYPSLNLPAPDISKAWYGYRPVSPDGMPYIGRHTQYNNLSYAGGHAMLGVSAAAGTGVLIEQVIGRKKTEFDISAFSPERFSN